MKLVTWNCARGFAKKAEKLFSLDPDIAVVQESLERDARSAKPDGYQFRWDGDENCIGLAIFWKSSWNVELLGVATDKWVVALDVNGEAEFRLIAVWSVPEKNAGAHKYPKLIRRALEENPSWFNGSPTVLAGDFNSNPRWNKAPHHHHASLVSHLAEHGLQSAYHKYSSEQPGSEEQATHHWRWKQENAFHVDYIFVPTKWDLSPGSFSVGTYSEWGEWSDHNPLVLDIQPNA
jgi:exodeoxyribonuclease-3